MVTMFLRVVFIAVAFFVAQMLAGAAAVAIFGASLFPAAAPNALPWQAAADLLIAGVVTWVARRSRIDGWRRAVALAALVFVIHHLNSVIEALFFGIFSAKQFFVMGSLTLVAAALWTPALLWLGPAHARTEDSAQPRFTIARFVTGSFAYLIAYFAAGMVIFPLVQWFYEKRPIPSGPAVISMQLLVRGPIFVLASWLLVRMSAASRGETILMVATALSVFGGVAPLMIPTTLMPDAVRAVHFFEVTISNFVFGAFLGWLSVARGSVSATRESAAAAAS